MEVGFEARLTSRSRYQDQNPIKEHCDVASRAMAHRLLCLAVALRPATCARIVHRKRTRANREVARREVQSADRGVLALAAVFSLVSYRKVSSVMAA